MDNVLRAWLAGWDSEDIEEQFGGYGFDDDDDDYEGFGARAGEEGDGPPFELRSEDDDDDQVMADGDHAADQPVPPLQALSQAVAEIAVAGNVESYSFGGRADALLAAPGLMIDGIGPIALPVVDAAQADKIKAVATEAPFGRDMDTLVDPAVRKSWQIEPSKVHLTHPHWTKGIDMLKTEIATKLGCEGMQFEMPLYKFLLYEPGSHFVKHRDTEKHDRMFATVVLQLPSVHEGGELVVYRDTSSDAAESITHDFGRAEGMAPFAVHYAVHYADAEHELKPVTSGYRLALVYSLCWPEHQVKQRLSAASTAMVAKKLAAVKQPFTYHFDQWYTPRSVAHIGADMLKATDKARFHLLQAANATLPAANRFVFYLATCTRKAEYGYIGGHNVEWELEDGPFYRIVDWHGVDGRELGTGTGTTYPFDDMDQVLNPDRRRVRDLWNGPHSRVTRYTGNEGHVLETDAENVAFVAKHVSNTAAADLFAASLDREDLTDDQDWVLHALQSITTSGKLVNFGAALLKARDSRPTTPRGVGLVLDEFPALVTSATLVDLVSAPMWAHVREDVLAHLHRMDKVLMRWAMCISAMNAVAGNDPPVPTDWLGDLLAVAVAAWPDLVFLAQQEQEAAWRAVLRSNAPELVAALVVLARVINKHTVLNPHFAIDVALTCVPALSPPATTLVPFVQPIYAELAATAAAPLPPATLVDTTAAHPDPDVQAFLRSAESTATITGRFTGIAQARKFVKQHENSPHFVAEAGGIGKRAFVRLTRLAAVREQAVQRRRVAEEKMRKYAAHFGEGVKGAIVEGQGAAAAAVAAS
ncbi:hypothetical protein AMAG_16268 [Allomyces macrogynus ATCC 38327]|uniref:Fe2OG dioxygenase domain-containing protein n=1 Tax=Allomyces macrogynus (strain ATCC 38327) TaxID=578462 RepID=A0A0L0TAU1_ALLM3|nr:hypothetical protein AMAG_16268 [Allomyces macrogynus ATCC 38327]|eukprot:KNE71836.1 hypothetical protein AMAG_16268 [Allomyces macrogynus ATCC 38327]